jgi:hypothetical protein
MASAFRPRFVLSCLGRPLQPGMLSDCTEQSSLGALPRVFILETGLIAWACQLRRMWLSYKASSVDPSCQA